MADSKLVKKFVDSGYSERDSRFYANIHTATEGGTKGIEVFEQPISPIELDRILDSMVPSVSIPPEVDWRMASDERSDIKRMFTDSAYRRDYFDFFETYALPKLSPPATA